MFNEDKMRESEGEEDFFFLMWHYVQMCPPKNQNQKIQHTIKHIQAHQEYSKWKKTVVKMTFIQTRELEENLNTNHFPSWRQEKTSSNARIS